MDENFEEPLEEDAAALEPEVTYTIHELVVEEGEQGIRLDGWLGRRSPGGLSRGRLHGLICDCLVTVDGVLASARHPTAVGQRVVVKIPPAKREGAPEPEEVQFEVVYEDADIAVVNKPAGLVVHPATGHYTGTLVNGLLHRFADLGGINGIGRPGIVHRLDKDTSGLMVVAKNDAAMLGLQKAFHETAVEKIYWALTHGAPASPAGTIRSLMGRCTRDRKRHTVLEEGGRPAVTHYAVKDVKAGVAWLEVRIETGRTHQIRVHCAHAGFAIVGDPWYGWRLRDKAVVDCPERQMLHAVRLGFTHPITGEGLMFERMPPADMADLMARLGFAT